MTAALQHSEISHPEILFSVFQRFIFNGLLENRSRRDSMLYSPSFIIMAFANLFIVSSFGTFFLFPLFITSHGGSKSDRDYYGRLRPLLSHLSSLDLRYDRSDRAEEKLRYWVRDYEHPSVHLSLLSRGSIPLLPSSHTCAHSPWRRVGPLFHLCVHLCCRHYSPGALKRGNRYFRYIGSHRVGHRANHW